MPLDSNGIWQYSETDPASPFSDLLNLLAASTSDAVADLASLIAALDARVTGTGANIETFGPGWKPTNSSSHRPVVRRIGNQFFLYGAVTKDTTLGAGSAGNLLTIPSAFRPQSIGTRFIGGTITSAAQYGVLALADGVVSIPAGYGTASPANGAVIPVVGQWWYS